MFLLFKVFKIISSTVKFLMKLATVACLCLATYEFYCNNFLTALIYVFMANMILTERRYSALKERFDAQEYL